MSDISLTQKQKLILKTIRSVEKPTANSIFDDEKIESLMAMKTLRNHLTKLEQQHSLIDSSRPKNCKVYSLTPEGSNVLERMLRRERMKKSRERSGFTFEELVDRFEMFYRDFWERGESKVAEAGLGQSFVEMDMNKLQNFDIELWDYLVGNPEQCFDACGEAVRGFPALDSPKNIRPVNVPNIDVISVSDFKAGNIEELVCVEGVIQSVTKVKADRVSIIFECTNCGDRYEKKQDSSSKGPDTPYKCDCGCRNFEIVDTNDQSVRIIQLKEKPDRKTSASVPVIVRGDLAEDKEKHAHRVGEPVRVYGYLETYRQRKRDDYLDYRLKAMNIELEDDKWDAKEISEEEKEEFRQLREEKGEEVVGYLAESFGHEKIANLELLKEALVLFPLTKTEHTNANTHFLCIGDPSTGKSHLARIWSEKMPKTIRTTCSSGTTKVGITGAVVKNDLTNRWEAEAGPLAMADGGYHITDEIDKLEDDDTYTAFNEALSDKQINLNKANVDAKLNADVSEFSFGNPGGSKNRFESDKDLYLQNPIKKGDLNSRYVVKLAVTLNHLHNSEDVERERRKVRKIIRRGREGRKEEGLLSTEKVVKYVVFASSIKPDFSEEAMQALEDLYIDVKAASRGDEQLIDARIVEGLKGLSVAFSKILFSSTVEKRHVELACDFFNRCQRSMGFEMGKDDMASLNNVEGSRKERILDVLQEAPENKMYVDDLVEEVDLEESLVEETLETLKNDGVVFEPKPGLIKLMK